MSTKRFSGRLLLVAATILTIGCAGARPGGSPGPAEGRVITGEQIRSSGAQTAWDALRRNGVPLSMAESSSGTPLSVSSRGRSSAYLDQTPLLVVDGIRLVDFRALAEISSQSIEEIRILNGIAGTRAYGTGAGNGVILIRTRSVIS